MTSLDFSPMRLFRASVRLCSSSWSFEHLLFSPSSPAELRAKFRDWDRDRDRDDREERDSRRERDRGRADRLERERERERDRDREVWG
jgi:hypothetical protein